MKIVRTTLLALVATAGGLAAVPAFAQPAPGGPETPRLENQQPGRPGAPNGEARQHPHGGPGEHNGPRGGGLGFLGNLRSPEAVEIDLVRLSHRLTLDATQQALFDTLRTDAIAAATAFATANPRATPDEQAAAPDLADRLDQRLARLDAERTALAAIAPAYAAFVDSLTEAQRAELLGPRAPATAPAEIPAS